MKNWILIVLVAISANAFGQQSVSFSLENVLDNKTVSTETYPSCEGMVIVFISNTCPYDDYYISRILKLSQTYNNRIPFVLVNANPDAADNKDAMVKKARQANITIPYLSDKEQQLMTKLNARKSPEAFLLKNNNGKFSIVYRGAIDDNPQVENDVRQHYLKDAIDIMLNNKKIETGEIRPVGCNLKKKT